MSGTDAAELARSVRGRVREPGEPGYDEARSTWNARFDARPDLIVSCMSVEDVRAAVDHARNHGLLLSVKSGGHSYAANTVGNGGLLIDLSPMKGIEIDAQARTARVEPGVKWGDLYPAVQAHGLALVGGTVSSVGVAGFILGGGAGDLTRKHGMGVDNLLSAQVVTADGRVVRAAEDENADLLWALRGGGGNFGIVTSFDLRLHEIAPEVVAGQSIHRFADIGTVLRFYRDFMMRAPEDIQCYAFLFRVPPIPDFPEAFHGQIALSLVAFSADVEWEKSLQSLLGFGDPILSFLARKSFAESQTAFDGGMPDGNRWESRSHYLADLSDAAIETFIAAVNNLPGEFSCAYFAAGAGAESRIDPSATAFPHRGAPFSIHVLGGWVNPSDDDRVSAWTRQMHDAMAPYSTGGVYVNLLGTDEKDRVRAAYAGNYERLIEIKKEWDPKNLFRINHNIDPGD